MSESREPHLESVPAPGTAEPPGPIWEQPEVAWPAALLAGFIGTYIGISSGIPAMGALLATAFFAPLYVALLRKGRLRLAAVLAVGWIFAIGASAGGMVLEHAFYEVARAVPGAWRFRDGDFRPWVLGEEPGAWSARVLRNALVVAGLLAVARPSAGLASLFGLACVASMVGAGTGWYADIAAERGGEPLLHFLTGLPPHYCFLLVGSALAAGAIGAPGRSLAASGLGGVDRRRQIAVAGGSLLALGLLVDPLLVPSWGAWLAGSVGP